jgi:indole-3-glycerol phosphate synthase
MHDFLDILAIDARRTIKEGYYEIGEVYYSSPRSLKDEILKCNKVPIISEIKFASPSMGLIRDNSKLKRIAQNMVEGGAIGISILTEPKHFQGQISFISDIRTQTDIPILMKDIILSRKQIDCAHSLGLNAVLLIQAIFDRGYCFEALKDIIKYCHAKGLEVLLEVHTETEFQKATQSEADMIGINNRNLETLEVDLETTKRILLRYNRNKRLVISESGINNPEDIRYLFNNGAHAFLVGTSIMRAKDITKKVRELVYAL